MEAEEKTAIAFCESIELEKTESQQFIYTSRNGKSTINLPYILAEYLEWLIENEILVKTSQSL